MITFTASNGETSPAAGAFAIDVQRPAQILPPVVQPIPGQSATIGQPFSVNIGGFASDPNTPPLPLTYSLGASSPSGASISAKTGVLTWTPAAGQAIGATTIAVDVSDDSTPPNVTVATITVDVAPAPVAPPVLQAVSQAPNVDVGQTFTLDLSKLASDPNPTPLPLSYSLGAGAPAGVSVDATTGLLTWNVPATQKIGTYPIMVVVSDDSSPRKTVSETISLSVADPGSAPTITSPAVSTKKGFSITFGFSVPVDPATASNAANYILTEPGKKPKGKHKPTPPPVVIGASVAYNQATNQVTLKLAKKPKSGTVLTLTIVGTGPGGIAKLDGLQLAGSGQPGTNYVATIRGKGISPTAAVTEHTIVVRTARAQTALVRYHSASSELSRESASGAPGGPLALARTPIERTLVLGVIPTGSIQRRR